MKRILFYVVSVVFLMMFLIWQSDRKMTQTVRKPSHKASVGTKDDPQARIRFEMERLKDPQTGRIPDDIRERELAYVKTLPVRGDGYPLLRFQKGGQFQQVVVSNWTGRGPYNLGGRTRALALDVTDENIILAGGVSGGMWRSTDGGNSWTRTTIPDTLQSVTCLVQDTRPGKTHIWYYGTGELRGNSAGLMADPYRGDGIFKSVDGGKTWFILPATSTRRPQTFDNFFDYVWNLVIDVSNTSEDEIYAATYGGIWRSTDGGNSWQAVLISGQSNYSRYVDVAITSTGVLYATLSSDGDKKGVWRSTDGINWVNITPSGWPATYNRVVIGIAPSNENVVYFLGDTPGSGKNGHSLWKYTYISGDGSGSGGQWENRSNNLPYNSNAPVENFDSQSSYNLVIKVKPDNENVVLIGGTNLYISEDGFATSGNYRWIGGYNASKKDYSWYPNHHPDQHALVFYPSNSSKLLSGHDGGVSVTENVMASTVVWASLNRGYYTTQFYTIALDTSAHGDSELVGGMQDNGTWRVTTVSATANWQKQLGGDGGHCAIAPGKKYYYFSWQNGTVFRVTLNSSGGWLTWAQVDPAGVTDHLFINPFILDAKISKIMYYAGWDAIWRNSDLTQIPSFQQNPTSTNWQKLSNTVLSNGSITALEATNIRPAHRLYYGTSLGKVFRLDNAHTGDPTPVEITGPDFPGGYINSIAVNPQDGNELIVVFSNYNVISLWRSTDGGSTWENISGNLEENPDGTGAGPSVRWAEIVPLENATVYFVGTSRGVYSTAQLNGPNTVWELEAPTTIGYAVVDMIVSRPKDGLVVAATHGNGVFSTNVSVVKVEEEPVQTVRQFQLKQNYPNPFNASTRIEFELPRAADVQLIVYDVQGREIARLVQGFHQPGRYSVWWNGRDNSGQVVPSGVYFYRLSAGSFSDLKRMVLVK
ncbi:MAG: T9SS type A sorting domain-containing protein [Calditrichaeota bacterium]|nr:T9SS type A sorting domain-containing protein [Calditrichota bacterium]